MARKQTKDEIAEDMYDEEFDYLSSGQKRAVTVKFNAQKKTKTRKVKTGAILAKVGRIGNGVVEKAVEKGTTVEELLELSGLDYDDKQETIQTHSGNDAYLDDDVEDGETYLLSPVIKSA